MLSEQSKFNIASKFFRNKKNSGLIETQCILFTDNIIKLTKHLSSNKRDFSSRKGLVNYVNKRKKLLAFLKKKDSNRFKLFTKDLALNLSNNFTGITS